MRSILPGFIALVFLASPAAAGMERCLIEVDGKPELFGRCNVDRDPDGSISVGTGSGRAKASPIFAYVSVFEGSATASWNEDPGASHAHSDLGAVTKSGSCWVNKRAKICAWK